MPITVLTQTGVSDYLTDVSTIFNSAVTTPVVMYATKVNNYDFGLMITASHNPHIYNGLKIFVKEEIF